MISQTAEVKLWAGFIVILFTLVILEPPHMFITILVRSIHTKVIVETSVMVSPPHSPQPLQPAQPQVPKSLHTFDHHHP